jgi:phage recombination protein Bet
MKKTYKCEKCDKYHREGSKIYDKHKEFAIEEDQPKAIAKRDDPNAITVERKKIIMNTVAKGANEDELKLFLLVARRTGLDPFMKQVYFIKRWDSRTGQEMGTIQVGIDGLRAIAEKTGEYAGSDDIEFDEKPGAKNPTFLSKATSTVYRIVQGQRVGFTATARWSEYYPGDKQGFMWRKMPYAMLGKCAEALALRKAFPQNMSSLYVHEEMDQAKEHSTVVVNATGESGYSENGNSGNTNEAYEKALTLVSRENDTDRLTEWKEKIQGSKLFNKEQKNQLIKIIDGKLNE